MKTITRWMIPLLAFSFSLYGLLGGANASVTIDKTLQSGENFAIVQYPAGLPPAGASTVIKVLLTNTGSVQARLNTASPACGLNSVTFAFIDPGNSFTLIVDTATVFAGTVFCIDINGPGPSTVRIILE